MSKIELIRQAGSGDYLLRMALGYVDKATLEEITATIPKLVAEQYVKDHMQEIMDRLSVSEISSCIAAAVAAKVAESYKVQPNA